MHVWLSMVALWLSSAVQGQPYKLLVCSSAMQFTTAWDHLPQTQKNLLLTVQSGYIDKHSTQVVA